MTDPSKFSWMLDWSHIAAAAFKSLFGYFCFLTFQDDTQQVITNNLHSAGFKGLVNIFLVLKALLSYPLPYYAACELLERSFFRKRPDTLFPTIWALDGELKVPSPPDRDRLLPALEPFALSGVGPGVPRRHRRLHCPHGHLDPALRHPDGLHRQLHRHDALLHLAVLLPPQAETGLSRQGHHPLRLLHHILGCFVWCCRRVRLRLGFDQSFRNWSSILNRKLLCYVHIH